MRLALAELLGMRRRLATYVVLGVLLALMSLLYLAVAWAAGSDPEFPASFLQFPGAYSTIGSLVFDLGSLVAVAYAAAIAGGDWTWGVPRLLMARGESRARYVLAKTVALAGLLAVGVVIAFAAGIVLNALAALLAGIDAGNPLAPEGAFEVARSVGLGYPVLLERALIAFSVAMVLRSQLAGVVVGILLYVGEQILASVLLLIELERRGLGGGPFGPEWYQYLPFSIGNSVMIAGVDGGGGLEGLLLRPVPLEIALAGVVLYAVAALAAAVIVVERREITA